MFRYLPGAVEKKRSPNMKESQQIRFTYRISYQYILCFTVGADGLPCVSPFID